MVGRNEEVEQALSLYKAKLGSFETDVLRVYEQILHAVGSQIIQNARTLKERGNQLHYGNSIYEETKKRLIKAGLSEQKADQRLTDIEGGCIEEIANEALLVFFLAQAEKQRESEK